MQRKQTIPKGNSLREVGVEHRDSAEVQSISPVSKRRKDDMQEVDYFLCVSFAEPPYTERYVRWCGRTGANRPLLPDCPQ